ncbi:MAG: hypothetical protein J5986_04180 [Roseburia sp.]|nr:hypothetical protein [Roseburia sp.]
MYHISEDKRAKQSAELLYQGLIECMKKKHFSEITITDLQAVSGIARTTFYRAFDNISDILYWKCDTCFKNVLGNATPDMFSSEFGLARHYFRYWMEHSDILELLVKINRQDIIYACHMKNADALQQKYGKLNGLNIEHSNYFMAIRTGFTISILTTWLKGGRKESLDEIMNIIAEQLSLLARNSATPF